MAKIADARSSGKGKSSSGAAYSSHAGPSGYTSPLDYPRSGSSSGKHTASPGRGGQRKHSRGGRGMSPSPKSKRGFRK